MAGITFTINDNHLRLLRRAYIGWDHCEFGAPAIDCKRPYGNSSVYQDIAEILGIDNEDGEFSDEDTARMRQLHHETQTVLQIVLRTGQMRTGTYRRADRYTQDWYRD